MMTILTSILVVHLHFMQKKILPCLQQLLKTFHIHWFMICLFIYCIRGLNSTPWKASWSRWCLYWMHEVWRCDSWRVNIVYFSLTLFSSIEMVLSASCLVSCQTYMRLTGVSGLLISVLSVLNTVLNKK